MTESEESKYYSDGIDPVYRASSDELFFLTIESRPEPGSEEFNDTGGAYVNCWVNADDLRTALRRAVALVEEAGWSPIRFEEWHFTTSDTYSKDQKVDDEGPLLREIVAQTFIDGEVAVSHSWPKDAPDADDQLEAE